MHACLTAPTVGLQRLTYSCKNANVWFFICTLTFSLYLLESLLPSLRFEDRPDDFLALYH